MSARTLLLSTLCLAMAASTALARDTQVEFDPTDPRVGPFPTDFLTLPDTAQRTGRRVNLPLQLETCGAAPSDCLETLQINQLDGFSPSARITVRFSRPINPDTLRDNVYIAWLDQVDARRFPVYPAGKLSPVNQIIWDPSRNTAYLKPDEMLEQTRSYLVVVTDGVRDTAGDPVESADSYRDCLAGRIGGGYCTAVGAAAARIAPLIPGGRRIAGASLFTTMSVTALLEEARRIVQTVPPQFRRTAATIDLANLRSITLHQHTATTGGANQMFTDVTLPFPGQLLVQSGVGRIAFGSFRSPSFYSAPDFAIPAAPTAVPLAAPAANEEVYFHAWLPRTPMPPGGYPVLIAGHGFGDSRAGMPTAAATATAAGFAVVAINAVGHGAGPLSSYRFGMADGSTTEALAPGRGIDIDNNGRITELEGCIVPSPILLTSLADCNRQTAIDLLQLAHTLRDGVDFDGDGRPDLNGFALHYLGQSMGGYYGTLFTALEPGLRAVVLNVPPGSFLETSRYSERPDVRLLFDLVVRTLRQPALPGDPDLPFRNEPAVRIRTNAQAAPLQEFVERMEWLEAPRAAMSYGPYLRSATLPGVGVRPILFQYAQGDIQVPNPTSTALIRAANMREFTSLYRADLARAVAPDIPRDVHAYLVPLGPTSAQAVSAAALTQAFEFLVAARDAVPNVNPTLRALFGRDLFETPEVLPEVPGFPPRP